VWIPHFDVMITTYEVSRHRVVSFFNVCACVFVCYFALTCGECIEVTVKCNKHDNYQWVHWYSETDRDDG
jgi:hypothetical protein